VRIGIIGLGVISSAYLRTLQRLADVDVVAVADLLPDRAEAVAEQYRGVRGIAVDDLLDATDVDLVLNLTIPAAHSEIALAALAAGKHVYSEKPLAATSTEAREVLALADKTGLRVGCAPDTVLGTGVQTARAVVDNGGIGTPFAATAFMTTPGHELWHPDPEFYYQPGGGPLLDMGPYYLTALVTLLGPVRRVVGMSSSPQLTRTIGSGPRAGTVFPVDVPTHVTGVLEHVDGALSTLLMSFDVWAADLPKIEVYGTTGSVSVPDPNLFDGQVRVSQGLEWTDVPASAGYREAARGSGVADMARAITAGVPHRAGGELAFHILDVMESLLTAASAGSAVEVGSRCTRPAVVPFGSG
jgi:predicted dehydrogenase